MNTDVLFSSEVMAWSTPQSLFDRLDNEFHFTLDACADKSNHKCQKYFTSKENGLVQSWKGETVYVNPPYGREQVKWIRKAYQEYIDNDITVVLLIPSRTDTKIFHEVIAPYASEIRFIKGRLKFSGHKNAAPFPSAIIVFMNTTTPQQIKWVDYS